MLHQSQLTLLLSSYLDGDIPLYDLRGEFYLPRFVNQVPDAEDGFYEIVSMHLAMFTVGTWSESDLKDAIRWHMSSKAGQDTPPTIPMIDKQWGDIMGSGMMPWPIQLVPESTQPTTDWE